MSPSSTTVPASTEPAASGSGANWTTYHEDAEATGVQPAQAKLLPSRQAWTSPVLDGQLFGEPLAADGRIVATTENDTIYVLAARTGQILWSRHLATPVPSRDLPCGDISPVVGTGKVELSQSAMPNAGEDQLAQLQRPGLALDDGRVGRRPPKSEHHGAHASRPGQQHCHLWPRWLVLFSADVWRAAEKLDSSVQKLGTEDRQVDTSAVKSDEVGILWARAPAC